MQTQDLRNIFDLLTRTTTAQVLPVNQLDRMEAVCSLAMLWQTHGFRLTLELSALEDVLAEAKQRDVGVKHLSIAARIRSLLNTIGRMERDRTVDHAKARKREDTLVDLVEEARQQRDTARGESIPGAARRIEESNNRIQRDRVNALQEIIRLGEHHGILAPLEEGAPLPDPPPPPLSERALMVVRELCARIEYLGRGEAEQAIDDREKAHQAELLKVRTEYEARLAKMAGQVEALRETVAQREHEVMNTNKALFAAGFQARADGGVYATLAARVEQALDERNHTTRIMGPLCSALYQRGYKRSIEGSNAQAETLKVRLEELLTDFDAKPKVINERVRPTVLRIEIDPSGTVTTTQVP